MNLADIIRARLAATSAITTLVGTRIYLEEGPDEEPLPLVIYTVQVGDMGDGTAQVADCTVEAHGYAEDDDTALALGKAISGALHDYSGQSGTTRLAWLTQSNWQETHSFDYNIWGRLLTFTGKVVLG